MEKILPNAVLEISVVERVGKIGVIPDVEEIRGEAQFLALGDTEILDQREIPVLLGGSAINVAAEVAEAGGAVVQAQVAACRDRPGERKSKLRDSR